jgi:ATP-dependent DNA ligase
VTTAGLPDVIAPMLATLGATPTGPGWGYEFKWDGVRAISYIEPFGARVLSRNDREVTGSYPELRETVRLLGDRQAVLDGEIVALDTAGRPSFAHCSDACTSTNPCSVPIPVMACYLRLCWWVRPLVGTG